MRLLFVPLNVQGRIHEDHVQSCILSMVNMSTSHVRLRNLWIADNNVGRSYLTDHCICRPKQYASIQSLPQELIEMIIDSLRDDKDALKATSLLHSSWTHHSQRHLHSSRQVSVSPSKGLGDPDRYSSPHIANLVQNLKITMKVYSPATKSKDGQDGSPIPILTFPTEGMWRTISKLQNVTNLTLDGRYMCWGLNSTESQTFFNHFRDVTHLTLKKVTFTTIPDCLQMVSSFPNLQDLTFHTIHFLVEDFVLPSSYVPPRVPHLQHLEITEAITMGPMAIQLGRLLAAACDPNRGVGLRWSQGEPTHQEPCDISLEILPGFLEELGHVITSLTIDGTRSERKLQTLCESII
ncbi:hypothetical protein C8Q75DRAFT_119860 [Abortiporus biennis]|nr:hypothetical protein C8Q75DRAFT_119860 [Abortiporus biennis]